MSRPVGYGRPETAVFPPDWQDTHALVIESTFDAEVAIGPAYDGTPEWNPTTSQTETTAPTPVYAGPATISAISNTDRLLDTAADEVSTRRYLVELPVDTDGIDPDGHVVRVTVCADPMLAGKSLDIDGVIRGSTRFSRLLHATLND